MSPLGNVPSKMANVHQEEAIEAASASMGDHEISFAVLGAKASGPGSICDGVVGSSSWDTSASGELDVNEGSWEVPCVCGRSSAIQSTSKASPVKSSMGAFPCRFPLL